MYARQGRFAAILGVIATAALSGCGNSHAPVASTSSALPAAPADPRGQLAARAAAAKDRRFIAGYALAKTSARSQAVMVTVAGDGTWRLDIQGGALGGSTDVALIGRSDGQYQCALAPTARAGASSAPGSTGPTGCVRVAAPGRTIAASVDPRVQYPFTSWLDILTDPKVAVAVTVVPPFSQVAGTCFAVESTTVTLAPPIESAIFCYTDDGTLTGVRAGFGTMVISGSPAAAPATVALPDQVVSRAALPTAAPPAPPAAPSGSGAVRSGSPRPSA